MYLQTCKPTTEEDVNLSLILHRQIEDNTSLAVWEIDETQSFFLERLLLTDEDRKMIQSIKVERRLLEWLGSRYLIRYLLQPQTPIHLVYEKNNRPRLLNLPYHISISHSNDVAAVMISKQRQVGIDVECIHQKVHKVADKFMSQAEKNSLPVGRETEYLILHWSAKEAMFKFHGNGGLSFKEQLRLTDIPAAGEGVAKGMIQASTEIRLPVYYAFIKNKFVLTYCYQSLADEGLR